MRTGSLDHWAVDAVGALHVGERTEKQLIASFCDKIAELSPQLVTFNGNSFDLPVLRYRDMPWGRKPRGPTLDLVSANINSERLQCSTPS